MAEPSNEETIRRYLAAHTAHDYDTVGALRDPDWTIEWPQSGERVHGDANDRAIMDNWPGGLPSALEVRVVGSRRPLGGDTAGHDPQGRRQRGHVVGGRNVSLP